MTEGLGVRFWPIFRKVREIAGEHAEWSDRRGVECYTIHGVTTPEQSAAFRAWIAERFSELL